MNEIEIDITSLNLEQVYFLLKRDIMQLNDFQQWVNLHFTKKGVNIV